MKKNTTNSSASPHTNRRDTQTLHHILAFIIVMSLIVIVALSQYNGLTFDAVVFALMAAPLAEVFINGESPISRLVKYALHLRK